MYTATVTVKYIDDTFLTDFALFINCRLFTVKNIININYETIKILTEHFCLPSCLAENFVFWVKKIIKVTNCCFHCLVG